MQIACMLLAWVFNDGLHVAFVGRWWTSSRAFIGTGMVSCTRFAQPSRWRSRIRVTAVTSVISVALCSCAFQSYAPKPLSREATLASLTQRSPEAPDLRQFMVSNGYDPSALPIKTWGLKELTLLAFYYQPDLDIARAQVAVAKAAVVTAGKRPNPGLQFFSEHHGAQSNQSPWTRGPSLELPIVTAGKRAARIEQAEVLAEGESINLANAAWQVRSRVRARLLDFYAARRELELLESEARIRAEAVAMLERRLENGMVSVVELGNERIKLADAQRVLEHQYAIVAEARIALAAATGIPSDQFNQLALSFSEIEQPVVPAAPKDAQLLALTNRLDIQRGLLNYAVAEAELKLQIANQYPDISLSPGYIWDQGDNIWSLAISLLLPILNRNQGPILEAQARRELEAQNFTSLQAKVITETESSLSRFQRARNELMIAQSLREAAQHRYAQAEKRFDLGYADRLERTASALELLAAQRSESAALVGVSRAQGLLEDALQRPLDNSFQLAVPTQGRTPPQLSTTQPAGRP